MKQRHLFGSKPNYDQRIDNFCHAKTVTCQYFDTKSIRLYIHETYRVIALVR